MYVHICTYIVSNQEIDAGNVKVSLIPVPGQLYVYKASIESLNAADDVSTTTSLSSFIIRVSTVENNLTTYTLLVCKL